MVDHVPRSISFARLFLSKANKCLDFPLQYGSSLRGRYGEERMDNFCYSAGPKIIIYFLLDKCGAILEIVQKEASGLVHCKSGRYPSKLSSLKLYMWEFNSPNNYQY